MLAISLLVSGSVLALCLGLYLVLGRENERRRELSERLSLLAIRNVGEPEVHEAIRREILDDAPPLRRALAAFDAVLGVELKLRQAGLRWKPESFLAATAGGFAAGGLAGLLLHAPAAATLALGACGAAVPRVYVEIRRKRRMADFTGHFPDALEMFARSLRAGHSFTGAIELVGREMPDPVGTEFRKVFDEQNLGIPLREAMKGMTQRVDSLDVRFFTTAVLIQRETGGNLAEIIDKIARVIRDRFRIQAQLKVFTAQARMTGLVLALLPAAVGAAIGALNPDYLKPLWFDRIGRAMVVAAVVMQLTGMLVIRRILRIKI